MTRPAAVRGVTPSGILGALWASSALAALPTGPVLQAVVSCDGQLAGHDDWGDW